MNGVANSTEIDPQVRQLMHEQGAAIEKLVTVECSSSGMWRSMPRSFPQAADMTERRGRAHYREALRIPHPSCRQEPTLRRPAVRHLRAAVLRPLPIGARIKRPARSRTSCSGDVLRSKYSAALQRSGEQDGCIDRRELTLPHATAGVHIEKVIVKPAVTCCIRVVRLRAVPEKTQRRQRSVERANTINKTALDAHHIRGERQSHPCDAGRVAGLERVVRQEPVSGLLSCQK